MQLSRRSLEVRQRRYTAKIFYERNDIVLLNLKAYESLTFIACILTVEQ